VATSAVTRFLQVDVATVRALLATQFPRWSELAIGPVASAGTDNALFRLGDDKVARLPRIDWATAQIDKEHRWLPILAPKLPLAIPAPLVRGAPGAGYPWRWAVHRWLDGRDATAEPLGDLRAVATQLAEFIRALQNIDTAAGPAAGAHNFYRGVPLARRDPFVRKALAQLAGTIDTELASVTWNRAVKVPEWQARPVWIHGDIDPRNLLVVDGRISAVIDFGGLGVGDPACDLIVAWNLLDAESRQQFRQALQVDDATWARGRGWALSIALIQLPYYSDTNPTLVEISRRTIDAVLGDEPQAFLS
jgi:aminoglycoside phosphotransferase (APT) family kinase protein